MESCNRFIRYILEYICVNIEGELIWILLVKKVLY